MLEDLNVESRLKGEHNGVYYDFGINEDGYQKNGLYRWKYLANYRAGLWELEIFTTKSLRVPEYRRPPQRIKGQSKKQEKADGTKTVLAKDCFTRPSEPCFWQGQLYVADFGATTLSVVTPGAAPEWPVVTRDMRPWCYNWWMGSAVDAKGLEAQADALAKAGFGGFHAIPIYGAKGWEAKYREFLSPDWMAAFADAVRIGNSRDLGVDLTMGSGWCFGGPQLKPEEGCWRLFVTANEKDVKKGMQVLWKGTDNEGKPRLLVTALTGQKVKRAGLGGQGPMMDPYSVTAMDHFLAPYTAAFDRPGAVKPEHLYHDSFEYFNAGWSPDFFAAFKAKRGYDLRDHLAELAGVGTDEAVARIKCDYRETLSDLIIEDVFPRWFNWCRARGIATRNEGHGAPANWLDFYALADVPETEMFGEECRDVLVSKFASSVAHLTGNGGREDIPGPTVPCRR